MARMQISSKNLLKVLNVNIIYQTTIDVHEEVNFGMKSFKSANDSKISNPVIKIVSASTTQPSSPRAAVEVEMMYTKGNNESIVLPQNGETQTGGGESNLLPEGY